MASVVRGLILLMVGVVLVACTMQTVAPSLTVVPEPIESRLTPGRAVVPTATTLPAQPTAAAISIMPPARESVAATSLQLDSQPSVLTQIGGLVMGLAGKWPYLYLAQGPGLTILDVTDPVQPEQVGQVTLADATLYDVAIEGDMVYLVGPSGLWTVDISDPSAPRQIGYTGQISHAVALVVENDLAYVAAHLRPGSPPGRTGLAIVDVTDPSVPTIAGTLDLAQDVYAVAVRNGLAYLGVPGGMYVVDVSNPAEPKAVGFYPQKYGMVKAIALAGDKAYITAFNDFAVLDLINPVAPERLGGLPANGFDIAVENDTAFVATGGLTVVDVSNPISPTGKGWYWAPESVEDVFLAEPYAYLVVNRDDLHVVDVSNPHQPSRAGGWEVVPGVPSLEDPSVVDSVGTLGQAAAAAVSNGYLYVVEPDHGLWVFDLADPATPKPVAFKELPGDFMQLTTLDNFLLYVAKGGLWMVDVSNPLTPRIESTCCPVGAAYLHVQDGIGYLATVDSGLRLLDMADPAHPVEIGVFPSSEIQVEVAVRGQVAYVAEMPKRDPANKYNWLGGGLRILDVTDPTAPQQINFVDTPGWVEDMAVVGDRVYLAEGGPGVVRVFDVSDPARPVEVRVYETGSWPNQVMMVENDQAIVPIEGNLVVFDQSEKGAAPGLDVLAQASVGAVADGYIYVPSRDQGLMVLRLPQPSPTQQTR